MISVVTAYYNRKELFYRTLLKLKQSAVRDFEVIAVDDGSKEEERLEDLTKEFVFLKVIRLEKENKWYTNSCIPFNIGFREAKGDIIILQNPECLHLGDVLKYVEENLKPGNYFTFSCYSLDKLTTEKLGTISLDDTTARSIIDFQSRSVRFDGDDGWYNHQVHRPVAYHFCSAILKSDLEALGGFDERYAMGIAFDDLEFLYRIRKKKLKVNIVENPIVLHQHHYINNPNVANSSVTDDHSVKLYKKNKLLFEQVTCSNNKWRANILNIDANYPKADVSAYKFLNLFRSIKNSIKLFLF